VISSSSFLLLRRKLRRDAAEHLHRLDARVLRQHRDEDRMILGRNLDHAMVAKRNEVTRWPPGAWPGQVDRAISRRFRAARSLHLRVLRRASRRCLARRRMMEDRHVAVLLEDLHGRFKGFGEALQVTNQKLDAMGTQIAVIDTRLNGIDKRLDGMDKRLGGVDKRLDGMDKRLGGLAVDMKDVKKRLTRVERATNGAARRRTK
jgi:hypothetical protein